MTDPHTRTTTAPASAAPQAGSADTRVRLVEETGKYVYLGEDGVSYEWDEEKHAWFPMWDEALMQRQQAAYGTAEEDVASEAATGDDTTTTTTKRKGKRKQVFTSDEPDRKKPKAEPKKRPNTSVYVTGLPGDTTEEELKEAFERFGILMEDIKTGKPKIKLYKDANGTPKGDALISYFKEESVDLCCNLMDDADFRLGTDSKIRVSKAVFQEKEKPPPSGDGGTGTGAAATTSTTTNNGTKKVVQKKLQSLSKRLDWFEVQPGKKSDKFSKVVVLKYMFTLKELEDDPALLLDLKEDVRAECEKLGEVTNVVLYDLEEDGIMTIRFKDPEAAELCIKRMNGRFFAQRRIEATHFDGHAKYRESKSSAAAGETAEEAEEKEKMRLAAYEEWLESQH
ncbi:nuclear mRNA splicing factor-associated protein [Fimicolochytrium jonesii]|uniref:nuclear mRNA splicing factor-associated protein n=1 Tax=Fimicolochytrium jonesii TaxID=1396493 RepID=UPI0022FDB761|nr:nuclear mRNA splicing factor-associated protein [Fimicolochytrium jonesii]KAI8815639.1 nuclear mRNA splicing factor-associated protein [Fimicolochytrium jonesii]